MMAFAMIFVAGFAQAQTTTTVGTGTSSSNQSPINRYYNYSASEILYAGSEIGLTGTITDIAFEKESGSNSVTIDEVFIYMRTTTDAAVSAAPAIPDYTLVYQGAFPNDNTGWMGVTLDTPFAFTDNTQNLSVLVVKSNQSWSYDRPYYAYTSTTGNTMAYYQNDSGPWTSGSSLNATTNRPNAQFTLSGVASCTSPTDAPTALTLSADSATAISGSFTAATSAPDSYLIVRSTSSTLTDLPVDMTTYTVGDALGGGTVIQVGSSLSFTDSGLDENTMYYYFVYGYNGACSGGPLYYTTELSGSETTPFYPPVLMGASNITSETATINWVSSGAGATYALDVATDAAFTSIVSSFTGITTAAQDVTGLTDGTMYYVRVMVEGQGSYATGDFTAENDLTPITVTGFNEDVIANGAGASAASTTNVVDGANYAFFANGFNPLGTEYTNGLPADGVLYSNTAPNGLQYFMAPYDANNDLRLGMDGEVGTLTLTTPLMLQEIYLGVTGGSGSASFTAEVTYDDATTDTFTGLSAPDWFGNTGYITNIGSRVNITDDGVGTSSSGPRIYAVTIDIPVASQLKQVVSVTFTSTTGVTSGDNVLNVFTLAGKVASSCAGTPDGGVASLSATTGGVGSVFTASASGVSDAAGIVYQWQYSADGATNWTDISGADAVTSDITAENMITTSYYRLASTCTNSGITSYSDVVDFTTTACTPSYSTSGSSWSMSEFSITEVSFTDATLTYNDHDQTDVVIPTLTIGNTYTFEVTLSGWMSLGVAVDFNDNGSFSDTDEVVALPAYVASSPVTYTFSVTIPSSVNPGTYNMRIWNREANAGAGDDPCGSYGYGTYADYSLTVDSNMAVASFDAVSLSSYPNPVVNDLNLTAEGVMKSVQVYTLTGQLVKSETIDATDAKIDMKSFATGVYFVKVFMENSNTKTIKILKQ
ncbi:hypothetical protein Y10_06640 [Neptunitalea sp. Y10]|uniref:Fibronectin type-III domain-containing protein n=2 Tax=Neptunitalea lumnitzerae TaxID=2965509 RepID=A0ABQ5MG64_9FLAO|nr:hypothetical protein Y10_06640 [Neptunitalea sp. Y10]